MQGFPTQTTDEQFDVELRVYQIKMDRLHQDVQDGNVPMIQIPAGRRFDTLEDAKSFARAANVERFLPMGDVEQLEKNQIWGASKWPEEKLPETYPTTIGAFIIYLKNVTQSRLVGVIFELTDCSVAERRHANSVYYLLWLGDGNALYPGEHVCAFSAISLPIGHPILKSEERLYGGFIVAAWGPQ